jgi:hypothetical protein
MVKFQLLVQERVDGAIILLQGDGPEGAVSKGNSGAGIIDEIFHVHYQVDGGRCCFSDPVRWIDTG